MRKARQNFQSRSAVASDEPVGIPALLRRLNELGIGFKDLHTSQSSLEDIFVGLLREPADSAA